MSDFFDTRQIRDDHEHWDALATRIARDAVRKPSGVDWLAGSRASWIAASLLLAAALAFAVPTTDTSAGKSSTSWVETLAPADDVGRAMILRDAPPDMVALIFGSGRGKR
jgi:hypothetical protein